MDSENQALMMRLAEEHGKEKLVVVLGAADPEGVERRNADDRGS
jgi:hypothetical protein